MNKNEKRALGRIEDAIGEKIPRVNKFDVYRQKYFACITIKSGRVAGFSFRDLTHFIKSDVTGSEESKLLTVIKSILELTSLRKLYLEVPDQNGLKITALPESLGNLTSLEILSIQYTSLTSLPESLGKLHSLIELDISYNKIRKLPESIGNLSSLQILKAYKNLISEIPKSIGNCKSITKLDLTNNDIKILPSALSKLTNLEILKIGDNPMKGKSRVFLENLHKEKISGPEKIRILKEYCSKKLVNIEQKMNEFENSIKNGELSGIKQLINEINSEIEIDNELSTFKNKINYLENLYFKGVIRNLIAKAIRYVNGDDINEAISIFSDAYFRAVDLNDEDLKEECRSEVSKIIELYFTNIDSLMKSDEKDDAINLLNQLIEIARKFDLKTTVSRVKDKLDNVRKLKIKTGLDNMKEEFPRLKIEELSEIIKEKDQDYIINVVQNLISNNEIYARYFESSKTVVFRQQPIMIQEQVEISEEQLQEALKVDDIHILRGGDWKVEGNQSIFQYKVKVENKSKFVISNVQIIITIIPPGLELKSDSRFLISSLIQNSFVSPSFEFGATDSCVGNKIESIVIFKDFKGNSHTVNVIPFEIEYVCNLLVPKQVTHSQFENNTNTMKMKEIEFECDMPPEIIEKELKSIFSDNFYMLERQSGLIHSENINFRGYSVGKYDNEDVGLDGFIQKIAGNTSKLIIKAMSNRDEKLVDLIKDVHVKCDEIKSDTELIKEYSSQIEDLFTKLGKLDKIEKYLKDHLATDWEKIKEIWDKYKSKEIDLKMFLKECLKIGGKRFIKKILKKFV